MEAVCDDLGIPKEHILECTDNKNRCLLIVAKEWFKCLEEHKKICNFPIHGGLEKRHTPTNLGHHWIKCYMHIYKKHNQKVIPLPKCRGELTNNFPIIFSQLLSFVSLSNYKNLWENAYKKYNNAHKKISNNHSKEYSNGGRKNISSENNRNEMNINLIPYDSVLRELIQRVFGCCILHSKLDRLKSPYETAKSFSLPSSSTSSSLPSLDLKNECHQNILPPAVAVETSTHFAVIFYPSKIETTLHDCLSYSPAILSKSYNKPMFMVYQIFQLIKYLHDNGLMIGDLRLNDIYLKDNLWLQIIPNLESNIIQLESSDDTPTDEYTDSGTKFDLKFAYDIQQFSLREYSEMWCTGQLSNFDYLTILNNTAGRRIGCPNYHHIMPWVTDFSQRNGEKWRDLSKSKYRLNKGDPHLDLMFNTSTGNNIPHHVSEFLSEITYYVYMARRTPKSILCQHVRPIWVPAEYPISIQRLQEWTPDECIPEFYTDPMVFKSIHEDLPDLELPTWASCPEDFIIKHREALESQHVSERLHNWIDLNFGYKLTGKPAVKSKNVCLSLVDNHKNLVQKGIVQLFTQPHPPKRFPSAWFSKVPPRLSTLNEQKRRMIRSSEDLTTHSSSKISSNDLEIPETIVTSPNQKSSAKGFLSSSSTSSNSTTISEPATSTEISGGVGNIERSMSYHTNVHRTSNNNLIYLPKDYNPVSQLISLENMEVFFSKTFLDQKAAETKKERIEKFAHNDLMFEDSSDHSFTNRIFSECYESELLFKDDKRLHNLKHKNLLVQNTTRNIKCILKEKHSKELQVIGCLIIEIFLLHKLRPMLMNLFESNFDERLKCCKTVALHYMNEIPKCMQNTVMLFLNIGNQNDFMLNSVSNLGIIRPTSQQILQLMFTSVLPFPNNYERIYALVRSLHNFEMNEILLQIYTYFNCDGTNCSKFDDLDRKRVLFNRKIAECKVKATCIYIDGLLEPIGYEQFKPIELVLPYVIDLLKCEETSILSAWLLFDPVATALGVENSQKYLLEPILRLYDADLTASTNQNNNKNLESSIKFTTSSSFKSRKSVKLYHHSFLLRLIVRFGLKCFLENFISPLIEAVGGCKEPEESTGFHYHSNQYSEHIRLSRSTKNLKYCNEVSDNSITLMSQDYYGDIQSQSDNTLSLQNSAKTEVEGIFTFENENDFNEITSADKLSSNDGEPEIKSLDSYETRMSNLSAEEATEDSTSLRPQKLAIDDIICTVKNININSNSKLSNNSSLDEDKISLSSQKDSPQKLNDGNNPEPIKSPTIPIPNIFRRNYELSTIDCEIGSKKSTDSMDLLGSAANRSDNRNETKKSSSKIVPCDCEPSDSLQASVITKISEAKTLHSSRISEMSTESLIWLSHRLGPVLTARFLTRNLLKMLTLCYVGQENLLPDDYRESNNSENLNFFTIADSNVVGDRNAFRVLECLTSIAALFGEQFILLQYLPHVSELIALCKRKVTSSLEGALISSLQLLKYLIPCLMDSTIMEQLQNTILDTIIHPIIRLLGSTKCLMPSGFLSRSVVARKLLDVIYVLSVRIGPEMSKENLCIPAIQRFFLIFDKAYGISDNFVTQLNQSSINVCSKIQQQKQQQQQYQKNSSYLSVDHSDRENISPPISLEEISENGEKDLREKAYEEIRDVFSPNLAHSSYVSFLKYLGESIMTRTVKNLELILSLCHEYEQPNYSPNTINQKLHNLSLNRRMSSQEDENDSNTFGTSVIGNRIEVTTKSNVKHEIGPMEVLDMVAYKFDHINTSRHLRGNWFAYWEHEIGRADKDNHLNLKQIKLQTFNGHTNTVRAIVTLDNENSFMSASKDKTVKLWSLRSEGDGKKITSCQFTYNSHKKSVHSLAFLESMRYVISCDSGVHLWDPFIGRPICALDSQTKYSPVSVVRTYPSPSPLIIAGTAESTVKIIDARIAKYVNEWKVTSTQNSIVRCLTCAPSGNWLAVGLSSGSIILLDSRTGMIMGSFKATDGELLQLAAANDQQIISSSLDHSISVWNVNNNTLQYQLKQAPEPAHCLHPKDNELIFATPANRIGIYSNLSSSDGTYSITKLRSDTLKGVLTSLAVLPLNRMLLTGNDCGNIILLC